MRAAQNNLPLHIRRAQSHSVAELHFGDNERFFNLVWGSFTGSFGTERAAPALLRSLCFFQTLSASCHFR
jgi:hypothetical protein